MVHFLLLCSHARCLDDVGDVDLAELVENPQFIPSYAWCDQCVTWQPVTEFVAAAPSLAKNAGNLDEGAHEESAAAAGSGRATVARPRLQPVSVRVDADRKSDRQGAAESKYSTLPATGSRHSFSRSE